MNGKISVEGAMALRRADEDWDRATREAHAVMVATHAEARRLHDAATEVYRAAEQTATRALHEKNAHIQAKYFSDEECEPSTSTPSL